MRADKLGKLARKLATGQIGELADRAREELRRREERKLYASGTRLFSQEHFAEIFTTEFSNKYRSGSGDLDFLAALRSHSQQSLAVGFTKRDQFRTYIDSHCPQEGARIISIANQILLNRFPIFNLGFVSYGDPPCWNSDPVHKITAPEVFYTDIDYLDPKVVGDSKVVWEVSRFQFVYDLGQAYWLTNDEKYPRKFLELLSDWRKLNRDYHGVNYCSALESAFRIHALIWGIGFFLPSVSLTAEYAEDLYALIFSCADFLSHHLSRHFAPNTHLLGEAYALYLAGALFPEFRSAADWQKTGYDVLLAELERQFTAAGLHAELSTAYHGYAVEFLLSLVALDRQLDLKLDHRFTERLQQGTNALSALQRPDGTWPHIGDEDGGRLFWLSRAPASDFRPLLSACRSFLGQQPCAQAEFVDNFWFAEPDSSKAEKGTLSDYLQDSGIIVSRSDNGMFSSFQCGKFGYLDSPHSHADMLHLDLSVGRDNFLVDPGTHVYTAVASQRNLYRSASVHNGPTISLLPLEKLDDPFGWLQKPDCRVVAYHKTKRSQFYRAAYKVDMDRHIASLSRAVLFVNDQFWIVCDTVDSATPVTMEWNFVSPFAIQRQGRVCSLQGSSSRLAIISCLPAGDDTQVTTSEFAISDDYLSLSPGNRYRLCCPSFGKASYLLMILPLASAEKIPEQLECRHANGQGTMKVVQGQTETLIASNKFAGQDWATDAELALLQLTGDKLQRAILLNGSTVTVRSREVLRAKQQVAYADIMLKGDEYTVAAEGAVEFLTPKAIAKTQD